MTVKRKRSAAASSRARDPMERFHDEWLGMVQPIDGLVVSRPALLEAQVARPDDKTLRDRFLAQLTTADPAAASIANLSAFFADILGLGPERWIAGDQLPDRFRLAVPDTGQLLAPTQALVRDARDAAPSRSRWSGSCRRACRSTRARPSPAAGTTHHRPSSIACCATPMSRLACWSMAPTFA